MSRGGTAHRCNKHIHSITWAEPSLAQKEHGARAQAGIVATVKGLPRKHRHAGKATSGNAPRMRKGTQQQSEWGASKRGSISFGLCAAQDDPTSRHPLTAQLIRLTAAPPNQPTLPAQRTATKLQHGG